MPNTGTDFDVIILGSGFAGSVLGAILASNGADVLLVDAATHPRFAVGESTTPNTLVMLRLLARRYHVPELETFVTYQSCLDNIGSSFGIKRNFGFMLHHEGQEPDPDEIHQFNTPSGRSQTSHLFRQDSDAYLFHTAIKHGCASRQSYRVADVDLADDHVRIVGQDGSGYTARYLVDASGFRSPIAQKLALREQPARFKHNSRSLFTHMIDVKTTDECLDFTRHHQPPTPWHQGTMHHMFDRGWFWSIPFNNEERSRNPLVSVGLTLDQRKYPKPDGLSPDEDFRELAARFPFVERMFAGAKRVREWVSTDRIQYSSRRTIGDRWCLMSHAAGFLDPLFSRGLSNTAEVINALSWRLLAALRDDNFAQERFEPVERLEQGLLDHNDDLVNCSFISFKHYELWDKVFRIWGWGTIPASLRNENMIREFERTGDDEVFVAGENVPNTGLWWPDSAAYAVLFKNMVRLCESVEDGSVEPSTAARQLMAEIHGSGIFPPVMGLADENVKFIVPSQESMRDMMIWLQSSAPEDMRGLTSSFAGNRR